MKVIHGTNCFHLKMNLSKNILAFRVFIVACTSETRATSENESILRLITFDYARDSNPDLVETKRETELTRKIPCWPTAHYYRIWVQLVVFIVPVLTIISLSSPVFFGGGGITWYQNLKTTNHCHNFRSTQIIQITLIQYGSTVIYDFGPTSAFCSNMKEI